MIILNLILCHLIGDYFLQNDFIANTKGKNLYHLFIHCVLYSLPFYILFNYDYRLIFIFISHFIIDLLKSKYKKINYVTDQIIHYICLIIYLF